MTYLKLKFTRYSISYYANDKERKPDDCIIKINCYGDNKKEQKRPCGTALKIKFFKNGSKIPPNECIRYESNWREEYGMVKELNLHYPISQFNDIILILRHEKEPLYLFIEEKHDEKENPKGGLLTNGPVPEVISRSLTDEGDYDGYIDVPIKHYNFFNIDLTSI